MLDLKRLDLSLSIGVRKAFLDGNDLKKDILNHMTQLDQFTFNIRTLIHPCNPIDLPSNGDFQGNEIISCIDYFPKMQRSQCHVYSYPYKLRHYDEITNHFPGGLFQCVLNVSLYDERPFEHEFFLRISRSFPLMERLTVTNRNAQKSKTFQKNKR